MRVNACGYGTEVKEMEGGGGGEKVDVGDGGEGGERQRRRRFAKVREGGFEEVTGDKRPRHCGTKPGHSET